MPNSYSVRVVCVNRTGSLPSPYNIVTSECILNVFDVLCLAFKPRSLLQIIYTTNCCIATIYSEDITDCVCTTFYFEFTRIF